MTIIARHFASPGNTGGANPAKKATAFRRWLWAPVLFGALILAAVALSDAAPRPGERTALVDGHRVAFQIIGSGRPAIVMISGLGDSMATFADVAAELGKSRTVILYDRAGYGASERGKAPRDARAAARELSGLLAQTGIAAPYVLSGHSLGGLYAEYYAAQHPNQVSGLILEDSRPADFSRMCIAALGPGKCLPPAWMAWFLPSGAGEEIAALAAVMDQVAGATPLRDKAVLVLSRPRTDSVEISFDSLWTRAQAGLAARYPGSLHLRAKAGGHNLHQDQREWFLASVQQFLNGMR